MKKVKQRKSNTICFHLDVHSKKRKNDYNKTESDSQIYTVNKLVVASGEREGGRGNTGVGDKKRVIMGLYETMCLKLLKIVKHYRIFKNLSFN